jgi:HK97 family phage prohead protease
VTIRRNLGGEVRAAKSEDGHHTVTLRAITPDVVDGYGSVWMPDAFDKALAKRLPVLAWSHDWSDPIGVGVSFEADDGGPLVTARLDDFDAVPRARQAYAQVSADPPTIRDCSVGFSDVKRRDPSEDELKRWPGCREVITSATMDELSLVLAGAVPGAEVVGVRSSGIRMAGVSDAFISREAAATLIAKTATGELTLSEALNGLNALDTLEDGGTDDDAPDDGDGTDAGQADAEGDTTEPEGEDAAQAGEGDAPGSTGGEDAGPDLSALDADIVAALELIDG